LPAVGSLVVASRLDTDIVDLRAVTAEKQHNREQPVRLSLQFDKELFEKLLIFPA